MNNAKKILGAVLLVVALVAGISALELNWSLIDNNIVNLTVVMHILQIIAVSMIIVFNKRLIVDYSACAILLFSGVKPANTLVNKYFDKINGVAGAAVPVVLLILLTLIVVALFILAYKTNHIAVGKALTVSISAIAFVASIVIGFLINALASQNGVEQIDLIAEGTLAIVATVLMIVAFFLTNEDYAKIAVVIATFLTWWSIVNEQIVTRVIEKTIGISSYIIKGIIPILLGIVCFELGKLGIKHIVSKSPEIILKEDADDDDEEPEE